MNDSDPPRPKRRWYQFSLRTFLVFVLIVGLGMCWIAVKKQRAQRRRQAVEAIRAHGGSVTLEDRGSKWLTDAVGEDLTAHETRLHMTGELRTSEGGTDEALGHLDALRDLKLVYLQDSGVTGKGLTHLEYLARLEGLELRNTAITDADLIHLQALTRLKNLGLGETAVSDTGLEHLKVNESRRDCFERYTHHRRRTEALEDVDTFLLC